MYSFSAYSTLCCRYSLQTTLVQILCCCFLVAVSNQVASKANPMTVCPCQQYKVKALLVLFNWFSSTHSICICLLFYHSLQVLQLSQCLIVAAVVYLSGKSLWYVPDHQYLKQSLFNFCCDNLKYQRRQNDLYSTVVSQKRVFNYQTKTVPGNITATVSSLVCQGLIRCIKEHREFSQRRPAQRCV